MSVNIPEGYKPLLDKMGKNLNEEELQYLTDLVNGKIQNPDKEELKKLIIKMTSTLNKWEKMKLIRLCAVLSIKGL